MFNRSKRTVLALAFCTGMVGAVAAQSGTSVMAAHPPATVDATLRRHLWTQLTFHTSTRRDDMLKVPRSLIERWSELLCYAA